MEMARARFLQHPYRKNDSFGEGLKYILIIDTFRPRLDFDHFSHSRSRGVQKMKKSIDFSKRERHFVETTLQTRAARGGAHRILENVTFEGRGCRVAPARDEQFRAAFPRAPGQS